MEGVPMMRRVLTVLVVGIVLGGCVSAIKPAKFTYVNPYLRVDPSYPELGRGAVATLQGRNLILYLPMVPSSEADPNDRVPPATRVCFYLPAGSPEVDEEGWVEWQSGACEGERGIDAEAVLARLGVRGRVARSLWVRFPVAKEKYGALAGQTLRMTRPETEQEVVTLWFWLSSQADMVDLLK